MSARNHANPERQRFKLTELVPFALQAIFFANTTPEEDERLVADLHKNGQRDPIIVVPVKRKPQRFVILDGHRRVAAAEALGWLDIEAVVRWDLIDADEATIEAEFLQFNLNRRHVHRLDQVRIVMRLFEIERMRPRNSLRLSQEEGEARDRVGRLLGLSGRHLQRLFRVLLTPTPVVDAVRAGRLSMVLGEQIEQLEPATQAEIAQRIAAGEDPKAVAAPYLDGAAVKKGADRLFYSFVTSMRRQLPRLRECIDDISPQNIRTANALLCKTRELVDHLLVRTAE